MLRHGELKTGVATGVLRYVFRAKRANRVKLLCWDGTGICLFAHFRWPRIADGVMHLSAAQLSAVLEGLDFTRVYPRDAVRPSATQWSRGTMTQGRIQCWPEAIKSATVRSMVDQSEALPTDIDALHALNRAERSALASAIAARDAAFVERDRLVARNAKLEHILAEIRRAKADPALNAPTHTTTVPSLNNQPRHPSRSTTATPAAQVKFP
jgi:hypothetical protein